MKKSFLVGVTLVSLVCTLGLLANLILSSGYFVAQKEQGGGSNGGNPPGHPPLTTRFEPMASHLGIYSKAAVSTDAGQCAEIGASILRQNGTAIDSAIATLFCTGAVNIQSMGIGGGFIMNYYQRRTGQSHILMARETAPAAATRVMFVNGTRNEYTAKAIGIPGEVRGYWEAKKRFGNPALSMEDLVEPTARMCEEGITVTRSHVHAFNGKNRETLMKYKPWSDIFIDPVTKKILQPGDKFHLPKLAKTLRAIARDEKEFYEGDIAKQIVCDIKEQGGIITEEDLKNYKATWDTALVTELPNSRQTVSSSPPPTSGLISSAILSIMDQFNHTEEDFKNSVTYHRFIETCKFGFAKRTLLGDWNDPELKDEIEKIVFELISEEYARSIRYQIRDNWTSKESIYYGAETPSVEDSGTSHISVLAPNGDAVSVTSSINTYFGSGIMSEETGILFNNQMDDFATPGKKNHYNIEPSEANMIKPGRRPVSSMSPTIIVDEVGDVKLVVGASGGPRIITSIAWVSMMKLQGGMNVKEAIDTPRLHHQLLPMKVGYLPGFDQTVIKFLENLGHETEELKGSSRGSVVQAVATEADGSIVTANYDWRKAGSVSGF